MKISRRVGIGTTLATAALLAGCGGPPDAGSAITYDGGRITEATLAADAQGLADLAGVPVSRSITEATLNRMATFVLVEQAAERAGVQVSQGEVDAAVAAQAEQFGSREALEQAALRQGVPPSALEDFFRVNLIYTELVKANASDPAKPETGEAIAQSFLGEVSNDIALRTNPRFGTWSAKQLQVVPNDDGLTREPTNALTQSTGGLTFPGQGN